MITTFFKLDFSRLRSKVITYRSYKKFHEEKFLNDLKERDEDHIRPQRKLQIFNKNIFNLCKQTRSLKKGILLGNQAPFVTKEFQKVI